MELDKNNWNHSINSLESSSIDVKISDNNKKFNENSRQLEESITNIAKENLSMLPKQEDLFLEKKISGSLAILDSDSFSEINDIFSSCIPVTREKNGNLESSTPTSVNSSSNKKEKDALSLKIKKNEEFITEETAKKQSLQVKIDFKKAKGLDTSKEEEELKESEKKLEKLKEKRSELRRQLEHFEKMREKQLEAERQKKLEQAEQEAKEKQRALERKEKAEAAGEAKKATSPRGKNIADLERELEKFKKNLEEQKKLHALLIQLRKQQDLDLAEKLEERQKLYELIANQEEELKALEEKKVKAEKEFNEELEKIFETKELQKLAGEKIYDRKQEAKQQADAAAIILQGCIEIYEANKDNEANFIEKKINELQTFLIKQIKPFSAFIKCAEELCQKVPDPSKMSDLKDNINSLKKIHATLGKIEMDAMVSEQRKRSRVFR